MASDAEMADYVADQLNGLGEIKTRRMFGEYCFYINNKPVGFLCDNQIMVKTNEAMRTAHPELPTLLLFEGAKNPMWHLDNPDDGDQIRQYFRIAYESLPEPKPKKPRGAGKAVRARHRRDGEGSPLNDPTVNGESDAQKR